MLLSTKQKSRNEVTLVVPFFVDVRAPPCFDHHTPCLVFGRDLFGVRDLRSVIVDNEWNRDRQEPKVSLARGKATLERLVEWFLN